MEAFEAILSRRSIRKYQAKEVPKEEIHKLLEAAMSAPSAGNAQPWHFVVITERGVLDKIPAFHPYAGMLREAPAAIVVCGDVKREKYKGFWVQDCAAATQNILLAGTALGLGTVWLGIYPNEDRFKPLGELLHTPESVIPFAIVSIGYPAEEKPPSKRYSLERIHHNKW